jgi:hypothetical protein
LVIKAARPEDMAQIVALSYASFYENALNNLGASPHFNKTVVTITDLITNHLVLVKRNEEDDTLIDGVFALKEHSAWWSTDLQLTALIFFIKPEKRNFKVARDLLKKSQEYAIMENTPIVFNLFAQRDVNKKGKLLKYLGFKECGSFFIFNPNSI